jgi:hypothetical protein
MTRKQEIPVQTRSFWGAGLAVAISAASVGTACSAKPSAPYPDVVSFCEAKAQAECQIASTCAIDANDCQAARASICNMSAKTAMTTGSGTRQYVQANAPACIAAVNSAYGSGATKVSFEQLFGVGQIDDTCARVFSGNAPTNAPCESPYDCTGNQVCSPVIPGSSTLVCAAPMPVALGAFCENPGSTCADDSYCAMPAAGAGYQCVMANQMGQPCDPVTAPCVDSQRCEQGAGTTGQTCEPRVGIGQSCQSSDDCAPSAPYCDPYAHGICTAGLSFATLAADCQAFTSAGVAIDAGAGN